MTNRLKNFLILNRLHGLKTNDIEEFSKHIDGDLNLSFKQTQSIDFSMIEAELKWSQENNHHIMTWLDEDYPACLREISTPPLLLYVWGDRQVLNEPQLAMVGSRTPTPIGIETAKQFAQYLVQYGLVITSGLARGIDSASHEGALASGKTIAVLGGGLNVIYPKENRGLAERISEQGAVISEFPLTMGPRRENFPRRNRLISGLSVGVLVVEGAIRSGSLITARLAGEQGREIFAVPGSIHSPLSHGCHKLIREGAKLVESAEDILNELPETVKSLLSKGPTVSDPNFQKKGRLPLDEAHQNLLCCIGFETTAMDAIIIRSGLMPEEISPRLLSLELHGYIKSIPGGYCRLK